MKNLSENYMSGKKNYKDKKLREITFNAKISVSNLMIFLQKPSVLPPW